jgi:hypothetical protein
MEGGLHFPQMVWVETLNSSPALQAARKFITATPGLLAPLSILPDLRLFFEVLERISQDLLETKLQAVAMVRVYKVQ